jgi:hypothetical protein
VNISRISFLIFEMNLILRINAAAKIAMIIRWKNKLVKRRIIKSISKQVEPKKKSDDNLSGNGIR